MDDCGNRDERDQTLPAAAAGTKPTFGSRRGMPTLTSPQDLGATDRFLTPWVVAMFHCPWHNSNLSHQTERQALTAMRTMEPLLFQHKTALVIAGHVHGEARPLFSSDAQRILLSQVPAA